MAHRLKLYITGNTAVSKAAVTNITRLLEVHLKGIYELEIIDMLKEPQLAEDDKIRATPTLIRNDPAPPCKLIGDFSNEEMVLRHLPGKK